MAVTERVWRSTPRQALFLRATEAEVLYGGAAGGGKTDALLALAAIRCAQYPGAHVLYLRREFTDLELSAIRRSQELFTGTGPTYNASQHRWSWPNGSRLQFGHIKTDADVMQYQSAEFDLILFDELTEFSDYQYTFLISRNRSTKVPAALWFMRASSNPGGLGHGWVKARFVDVARERTYTDPESGTTRRFIPSKLDDNPHLDRAAYSKKLAGLSPDLRRALREGDWDIFQGAAFAEWCYDIHTCAPFTIPAHWARFTATDWGRNDPCATYWMALSKDGDAYVYRERYAREVGARETARDILGLSRGERIAYNVIGGDVEQKRDENTPTIGEMMRDEGFAYQLADMSPGARLQGKERVHDWLRVYEDAEGKTTRLHVFQTCENLIRTLPAMVYDRHRVEDVAQKDDHCYDALRYALMSRPQPVPPKAYSPSEALVAARALPDVPWQLRDEDGGTLDWRDA